MQKSLWFGMIVALLLAAIPFSAQADTLDNGEAWLAQYYPNPSLSGQPIAVIRESELNQDWGKGAPALSVPVDNFSARWTATRNFEEGVYLFVLTVDDGARLWIDGKLIIDAWSIGKKTRVQQKVHLPRDGDFDIQVAYFEKTGNASIHLEFFRLGGAQDSITSWEAEYYSNPDLRGNPAVTRRDAAILFDWDVFAPDPKVPRDNFSVRWTRDAYLYEGTYRFRIRHDDGMRIYINGQRVYNSWREQAAQNKAFEIELDEGDYTIVVEYYDNLDKAVAQVELIYLERTN